MIIEFKGSCGFLSNFYPCPITYEGLTYPTSEHAFQAAKSLDRGTRLMILELPNPRSAKYAGRRIELREDWEDVKLAVMKKILQLKFNPEKRQEMAARLHATGSKLLCEGNNWGDDYWGAIWVPKKRPGYRNWAGAPGGPVLSGHNHLGIILMGIRPYIVLDE